MTITLPQPPTPQLPTSLPPKPSWPPYNNQQYHYHVQHLKQTNTHQHHLTTIANTAATTPSPHKTFTKHKSTTLLVFHTLFLLQPNESPSGSDDLKRLWCEARLLDNGAFSQNIFARVVAWCTTFLCGRYTSKNNWFGALSLRRD